MKRVIFATGNKGKLKEVKKIFEGTEYEVVSQDELGEVPEVVEDKDTFRGNAEKKARSIYEVFGVPVMADDSGLAVEQLNGAPGVYSARYAGENCTYDDNNRKLLEELEGKDKPHKAEFITCAVYIYENGIKAVTGTLEGEIINELRGDNGFGYDPVFVPEGDSRTLAEMSLEEKNRISHRAKAFLKLKELMCKE